MPPHMLMYDGTRPSLTVGVEVGMPLGKLVGELEGKCVGAW